MTDALGHHTYYEHNNKRLTLKASSLHYEAMQWDHKRGLLTEYKIGEIKQAPSFRRVLDYDAKGNILCESLHGIGLPTLEVRREYNAECQLIREWYPSQLVEYAYIDKRIALKVTYDRSGRGFYKKEIFQYDNWDQVSYAEVTDGKEKVVTHTHRNERGLPDEVLVQHNSSILSHNYYTYDKWERLTLQRRLDDQGTETSHAA